MCVEPQVCITQVRMRYDTQFAKPRPHCIAVREVATLRQSCRNTSAKKSMHVCNIYL
jgi:hypothetical protein